MALASFRRDPGLGRARLARTRRGFECTGGGSSAGDAAGQVRLGGNRHLGELLLGPAAGAHGVVELDHPPAPWALPAQLTVLPAVEDGGEQPEERDERRDEKPDEERAALHASDNASGHPEEEEDDQQPRALHEAAPVTRPGS